LQIEAVDMHNPQRGFNSEKKFINLKTCIYGVAVNVGTSTREKISQIPPFPGCLTRYYDCCKFDM
jgi:hypothetical protein